MMRGMIGRLSPREQIVLSRWIWKLALTLELTANRPPFYTREDRAAFYRQKLPPQGLARIRVGRYDDDGDNPRIANLIGPLLNERGEQIATIQCLSAVFGRLAIQTVFARLSEPADSVVLPVRAVEGVRDVEIWPAWGVVEFTMPPMNGEQFDRFARRYSAVEESLPWPTVSA